MLTKLYQRSDGTLVYREDVNDEVGVEFDATECCAKGVSTGDETLLMACDED